MLQGDEVRACWQAPSEREPPEGLFREPVGDAAAIGTSGAHPRVVASEAPDRRPRVDATRGDAPGGRVWVIPIVGDVTSTSGVVSSGLREATHVPARGATRAMPSATDRPGSADGEVRGVLELPAIGQGDQDRDEARALHGILDDPEP